MNKPPSDVLAAARRIRLKSNLPGDDTLIREWLAGFLFKPPSRLDTAAEWVCCYEVFDAPSRYKDIEAFVARSKHAPHLLLGAVWPPSN